MFVPFCANMRELLYFWIVFAAFAHGCALQSTYYDCFNKNNLKVMGCETKNAGPMFDYYSCLCDTKKALYNCYSICSDDPSLQLQGQNYLLDITNTCQQADNYKALLPTVSSVTVTSTASTSPSPSSLPIATTTKQVSSSSTSSSATPTSTTRSSPNITIVSSGESKFASFVSHVTCIIIVSLFSFLIRL